MDTWPGSLEDQDELQIAIEGSQDTKTRCWSSAAMSENEQRKMPNTEQLGGFHQQNRCRAQDRPD